MKIVKSLGYYFHTIEKQGPFGDETSWYHLKAYRDCTVKELFEIIKNSKEWGEIYLGEHFIFRPNEDMISYTHDEFKMSDKAEEIWNKVLDKKVTELIWSGGWSRVDYEVYVEGEKLYES